LLAAGAGRRDARPRRAPLAMAEKFGKYEVVRKIGSGGYGEVYEARDPDIGRPVAIKTCAVGDEESRARFLQEARLAGNLHHRNLTTLYDFGSEGDLLYLVWEFLPGEDLETINQRGRPLTLRERVEILIGITYGLGHAHDAGIVHRDVKPGNIRILPDGTVKIMDFGIAKFLYADRSLTRKGFTLGTSSYLAPEQVRGDPIDRRADVFSFGVLAYEFLSGRKPFEGKSRAAILDAVASSPAAPLAEVAPDLPSRLAQLVERCLRKDPEERYASMEPVRRELLAVRQEMLGAESAAAGEHASDSGPAAPAPPGRVKLWVVWASLLAGLAAACALLIWLFGG
jgi:serine/threonine-protein kinase